MSNWLTLALVILRALAAYVAWMERKDLLNEGGRLAIAEALKVQHEELTRATRAREEARKRNASVPPTSSLPDDGFRRD